MNIFQKVANWFKTKSYVGLDTIARLLSGSWGKTKYLETYKKSLYVYACVSKIAEKVASTRFQLFQIINSKGDVKEVYDHPALDLIYRPNKFQTKSEFLEIAMINQKLSGNAFWWKIRDTRNKVVNLWNLRPDRMTIVKDDVNFIKAYEFNKQDGSKIVFEPTDIIHMKYPSPLDEYWGISPLAPASVRVDIEEYANRYQRDFFLNNARPDAVLEFEGELMGEQKDEIREDFEDRHKGRGKNSKIAVLEGGVKYQQVSLSQREMDYIESMKFTRDDILVAFKVPKPIIAITDDVNRANAETAMFIFLSETIKPELERMCEKLNEELIYTEFGERFFLDFPDPTPENREAKLLEYEKGLAGNWMLINEVRDRENLPPLNGGNSFYMPLGMTPTGGLAPVSNKPEKDNRSRMFGKPDLRVRMQITESATEKVMKGIKFRKGKFFKKKEVTPVADQVAEAEKKVRSLMVDEELRGKYYALINKKVDARSSKLQEAVNQESRKQLKRVLSKVDDVKAIEDMKVKIKPSALMDVKKENKLMAELVLPFMKEYYESAGNEAVAIVAPAAEFEMSAQILKNLEKRAKEFAEEVNNTTLEKLTRTLGEGITDGEGIRELQDRVEAVYEEFPSYRSERIARTETTAANNEGSLEGYKQSGVANGKEWIATQDSRTRDEHLALDGDIVGLNDSFGNGLKFPSEPNCRCVIAPAFIEQ